MSSSLVPVASGRAYLIDSPPTNALVTSQVVLSIALPLPMIALLLFTGRADIMGRFANGRPTAVAALVGTALVLLLNAILILQTFGVPIPGLAAG